MLIGSALLYCATIIHAAVIHMVIQGLRPTIPKHTLPKLAELLERCWQQDPTLRPDFTEIIQILQQIAKEVASHLSCIFKWHNKLS